MKLRHVLFVSIFSTTCSLADVPKRVVVLTPALAETVALLDQNTHRIVGHVDSTVIPLSRSESVGKYSQFNIEKVVAARPDLVLATDDGNPKDRVRRLGELGIPVVVVRSHSLSSISESIRLVGEAIGRVEESDRWTKEFARELWTLKKISAKPKKVLLQLSAEPLIVVGGRSFLNEIVGHLGFRNVYSDLRKSYARVSLEDARYRKPDHVVIFSFGNRPDRERKIWPKSVSVHLFEDTRILRPSFDVLAGMKTLAQVVQ